MLATRLAGGASADDPAAPPVKIAVPAAAPVAQADGMLRELYGKQLKDPSPTAKRDLAHTLTDLAQHTHDDPAARYAADRLAVDTAADAGDVDGALLAVNDLSTTFTLDGPALEIATLKRASGHVRGADAYGALATHGLNAGGRLLDAERYADAAAFAPIIKPWGIASGNATLKSQVNAWAAFATTLAAEHKKLEPSIEVLGANPTDPTANAAAGRFYCLTRGDWAKGLPMMARGPQGPWQAAAAHDLATTDAAAPQQQVQLAAAWWDLAQKQPVPVKGHVQARAAMWYRLAAPHLDGLARAIAEERSTADDAGVSGGTPSAASHAVELTNPGEAPEGQRIVDAVMADAKEPFKGSTRVTLAKVYNAAQFKRHAGNPKALPGQLGPMSIAGRANEMMLFGVYEKFPAASYVVVYRVQSMAAPAHDEVCFCDVCRHGNTVVGEHPTTTVMPVGRWSLIALPITLADTTELEFRLWAQKNEIALDRVYVFRLEH